MTDHPAARAARAKVRQQASTSPYDKDDRMSVGTRLWVLGLWVFEAVVAVWLGQHGAPRWMVWGFSAIIITSALITLVFGRFTRKLRRRKMLMARQQVHAVRQLDPVGDPVGFGFGTLHDAYSSGGTPLDRESAMAGAVFAIEQVREILDSVERTTPKPGLFGRTLNDDGTYS